MIFEMIAWLAMSWIHEPGRLQTPGPNVRLNAKRQPDYDLNKEAPCLI